MTASLLPICRHRGAQLGADSWICHSPLVVAPAGIVSSDACRRECAYPNHSDSTHLLNSSITERLRPLLEVEQPSKSRVERYIDRVHAQVAVAVCTAPRTVRTVDRTLHELRAGGFLQTIHVFKEPKTEIATSWRTKIYSNRRRKGLFGNWLFAARTLLETTRAEFILICEDDIALAPCTAAGLTHAIATLPHSDWGYCSLFTPLRNIVEHIVGSGWQPLDWGRCEFGAQAYCLSRAAIEGLINLAENGQLVESTDTDILVTAAMRRLQRKCYFHLPSLAEHLGVQASTIGHRFSREFRAVGFSRHNRQYVYKVKGERPRTKRQRKLVWDRRQTTPSDRGTVGFSLITSLYDETVPERRRELATCMQHNLSHPSIDRVYAFYDVSTPHESRLCEWIGDPRLQLIPIPGRLTFQGAFDFAGAHCAGSRVILANADIYFDESLKLLAEKNLHGRLICLNRWDVAQDGQAKLFELPLSQDAWVFQSPLPKLDVGFPLGWPNCDGRLAMVAVEAGLKVVNPARSVRAFHLHQSGIRHWTWNYAVRGPLRATPPCTLDEAWNVGLDHRSEAAPQDDISSEIVV